MASLKFLCALAVLFFVSSLLVSEAFAVDKDSAYAAVERAEADMVSAYQAVSEAEQVGVNASGSLVQLNEAGENLAKAEVAYRLGDFDAAINFANSCSETSRAVKIEADQLRLEAFAPRHLDMLLRMTGSIFGVMIVIFGSFWAWQVFKRRYYRRVLDMKPEVVSGES